MKILVRIIALMMILLALKVAFEAVMLGYVYLFVDLDSSDLPMRPILLGLCVVNIAIALASLLAYRGLWNLKRWGARIAMFVVALAMLISLCWIVVPIDIPGAALLQMQFAVMLVLFLGSWIILWTARKRVFEVSVEQQTSSEKNK